MKDAAEVLGIRGLVDVRPGEAALVVYAVATAFFVVSLNVVAIGTTTALVLGEHAPTVLPRLYSAGAVFSILATLALSSTVGRRGRWLETAGGLFAFAASLVLGWAALHFETRSVVLVLYPWGTVGSSLFVVQAFTLTSDTFDSGQARRLFPVVGAGGSLGAIAGGTGLFQLAGVIGVRNLLLVAAALAIAGGFGAHHLLRRGSRSTTARVAVSLVHAAPRHGWRQALASLTGLFESPLLVRLVLVTAATGIASTIFRFVFDVELKRAFPPAQIAAFIGGFNVACNVGALLVQGLFERRLIRATGFVAGLASLPLILGLGTLAWLFVGGLWAMATIRWAESVARYSVARTADELVVVPLLPAERRRARLLLGGLVVPVATLTASTLLAAFAEFHPRLLAVSTLLMAATAALAALSTPKPYWEQLRAALSSRRIEVAGRAQTALLHNERTLAVIEAGLAADSKRDPALSLFLAAKSGLVLPRERVESFYGHSDELVRRVAISLAADWGNPRWVPALIEVLQHEKSAPVAAAAVRALAEVDSTHAARNLQPWLFDPRPDVRLAVLGMVGGEAALPQLISALRRRDQQTAASEALRRRPHTSLVPHARRDPMAAASDALRHRHHAAVIPALAPLLTEGNEAGLAAVRILGQLPDPRAAAALLASLSGTYGLQRRHVLRALGRHQGYGCDFRRHHSSLRAEIVRELEALLSCSILLSHDTEIDFSRRALVQAECRFQRRFAETSLCEILALTCNPVELHRVATNLAKGDRQTRSLALDLLRHVLPDSLGSFILPFLEDTPPSDLVRLTRLDGGWSIQAPDDWRVMLRDARHPWLRWLGLFLLGGLPRSISETKIMSHLNELYMLRGFPLFADLTPDQLLSIAELSEQVEVSTGTVVFEQGDPGDAFFFIVHGEVVVKRGAEILTRLRDRDCFGEAALLDSGVRTATVVAATDCELSVIARDDFDDLIEAHPSIARGMLAILARRLARAAECNEQPPSST